MQLAIRWLHENSELLSLAHDFTAIAEEFDAAVLEVALRSLPNGSHSVVSNVICSIVQNMLSVE